MESKPHIPLSELRKMKRLALAFQPSLKSITDIIFKLMVENEVQRQKLERLKDLEPVPDGTYGEHDTITVSKAGKFLEISSRWGDGSKHHKAMILLPCGWTIYRNSQE